MFAEGISSAGVFARQQLFAQALGIESRLVPALSLLRLSLPLVQVFFDLGPVPGGRSSCPSSPSAGG